METQKTQKITHITREACVAVRGRFRLHGRGWGLGRVNPRLNGKINFAHIQTLPDGIEFNTHVINPGHFNQYTNYHRVTDSRVGVFGIVNTVRFAHSRCSPHHTQNLIQG